MRKSISTSILAFSAAMNLRSEGNEAAAKLITEATTTPTKAKKIIKKWRTPPKTSIRMSPQKALSLIISENLTKKQYLVLRLNAREHGHDLYPAYDSIVDAKKFFYPANITVTEKKCEVPLKDLLEKTCDSIISNLRSPLQVKEGLILTCKWGFDGSSGYSQYKQQTSEKISYESVFITSMVPLQLMDATNTVIWKNPRPSSTRFCRPIRVQWLHETNEISKEEEDYILEQINKLEPYPSKIGPINYLMLLTMVDGKICNALGEASGMRCYICNATPTEMNKIQSIRNRPEQTSQFRFGLSVLHASIRFFECLLHIAYRLDVKKWRIPKEMKHIINERKNKLQQEFREKMGLIVDMPKPGFGTSNDGNTAKRFFKNPTLSATISGIDEKLIRRFSIILKALRSGRPINVQKFHTYCLETAEIYVELYEWYYMPTTVHKILIHGASVIENFIIPIGQLSEEAAESKNKEFRFFREHFTRKSSRENTNNDLFRRLLLSSDPLLSTMASSSLQKTLESKKSEDQEMWNLLIEEDDTEETNIIKTKEYKEKDERKEENSSEADDEVSE